MHPSLRRSTRSSARLTTLVRLLTTGILGSVFSSASSLVVGSVLAVFMLLFLLKDWQQLNTWTAGHIGLPEVVGTHASWTGR